MAVDTREILYAYTTGKKSLEETNAALKEAGANFHLEPGKNELTEDEIFNTVVSKNPALVTGYGLLDTGTGSMEKVHVVNGKLEGGAINTVNEDGTTNMLAYVLIGDMRFEVKGDALARI